VYEKVDILCQKCTSSAGVARYSVWGILQEKLYKTRITDLDEMKEQLRTEWARLAVVIAAAIRQWRRR